MRRRSIPLLSLLALAALAGEAPAGDFARLPDGRLRPGCEALGDAPSLAAKMEFQGGIRFAEGAGPARPADPEAAVGALQVGPLRVAGDEAQYVFLDKKVYQDGFVVVWKEEADAPRRVALWTSWASLRDPRFRAHNVVCREAAAGAPPEAAPDAAPAPPSGAPPATP